MERWYKEHKGLLINLLVAFVWLLLVWLSYVLFPNQPRARIAISRIVFVGITTQLLILAVYRRRETLRIIK